MIIIFILSNLLEYFQQKQVEEVTDFIEDDKIWPDATWPLKKDERQVPIIDIQLKIYLQQKEDEDEMLHFFIKTRSMQVASISYKKHV